VIKIPLIVILVLAITGCEKRDNGPSVKKRAEIARQDSLMAVIANAQHRAAQGQSRLAAAGQPAISDSTSSKKKFSSFTENALKAKTPAPGTLQAKADTVGTLDSAIATNAKIIKVDSGSAEDRRLDSLMRIANTLSYQYQQMVMTHTHRNLAEAAHQNPAKTRRLLNKISEAAPEKFLRAKRAGEMRNQRLLELQIQMQQGQKQQQGFIPADSGK
jgi:hypothetical protein